jgi:general stress protein YciG
MTHSEAYPYAKILLKMSEIEPAVREHLRALGRKGAAATKRRYADDPNYYRSLGRLGGAASSASRRATRATRAVETPRSRMFRPDLCVEYSLCQRCASRRPGESNP